MRSRQILVLHLLSNNTSLNVKNRGIEPLFLTAFHPAAKLGTVIAGVFKRELNKWYKGTKGKNREANATELYELAKKGHEPSLQFLQEPEIGILKGGSRPHIDAKGFYAEDLQDETKREYIIEYIKQKMRS
ncbi:hypothetical protein NIES2130_15670 [Scytonema sp. HK-05]|nr:hypothetical protein NIES2130_15670 [Scytonema sp. HK-05]